MIALGKLLIIGVFLLFLAIIGLALSGIEWAQEKITNKPRKSHYNGIDENLQKILSDKFLKIRFTCQKLYLLKDLSKDEDEEEDCEKSIENAIDNMREIHFLATQQMLSRDEMITFAQLKSLKNTA